MSGARQNLLLVVAIVAISSVASAHVFFSLCEDDGILRRVDYGFPTQQQLPIALPGETVTGGHSLAADHASGRLYGIVTLASAGAADRALIELNPYTGEARLIGSTGLMIADIAIDDAGVCWGVTDDGATPPETLFELSLIDGQATFRLTLGAGDTGEAIAYHEPSGLLYHASGQATRVLETIDPVTLAVTPVPLTGDAWMEPTSLWWDDEVLEFAMFSRREFYFVPDNGMIREFTGETVDHDIDGFVGLHCVDCGDCNLDGQSSTILDALTAAQIATGLFFPASESMFCCDVDKNRAVNILDSLVMAQLATGLPVVLLCYT